MTTDHYVLGYIAEWQGNRGIIMSKEFGESWIFVRRYNLVPDVPPHEKDTIEVGEPVAFKWAYEGDRMVASEAWRLNLDTPKGWAGLPLAEPGPGLSPREKAQLLRQYLHSHKPLFHGEGPNLQRLDFSGADLAGADLSQATLLGVNLIGATLDGATLAGARVDGALLARASLRGANCWAATFFDASLDDADISDVDFHMAQIEGASLRGVVGSPAALDELQFDLATYERSGWTPGFAARWCARGARPVGLNAFPMDVREAILGDALGLSLYFPRPLPFMSQALVNVVLAGIVGDSAMCSGEYAPTPSGGARIRLSGVPMDELARVADSLAQFFDRTPAAQVTLAIERAVPAAVERSVAVAVERALPDIVERSMLPMAALQEQLGARLMAHITSVYSEVERTEIRLATDVAQRLNNVQGELIELQLANSGWRWDQNAEALVRDGGWAVTTGVAGNAVFSLLVWVLGLGS